MGVKGFGLFALLWIFPSSANADRQDQVEELLRAFSASCQSQAEWTQTAIGHAQAIIRILEAEKDNKDCQVLAGSTNQVHLLDQKLKSFQSSPNEKEILKLKKQQQSLLFQLSVTSDPDELLMIKGLLQDVQFELAGWEGYEKYDQDKLHLDRVNALNDMLIGTEVLLNQAVANQACLTQKPNLMWSIVALAGSVGAALSTSGGSLLVSAAVQLVGLTVEWIRKNGIQNKINEVTRGVELAAYECVLESLSDHWCSAQDAVNIVDFKASTRDSDDPVFRGIRMLDRDVPDVLDWFQLVRSGTPANTETDADKRSHILRRESIVRTARWYNSGIVRDQQLLFDKTPGRAERWQLVKAAIVDLINNTINNFSNCNGSHVCTSASPLAEVFSNTNYIPYFLLGITEQEYLTDIPKQSGLPKDFSLFDALLEWPTSRGSYVPDLNVVSQQMAQLIDRAAAKVALERTTAFYQDASTIIADATIPRTTGPQRGVYPLQSMRNVSRFLNDIIPNVFGSPMQQFVYEDTIERLNGIVDRITAVEQNPGDTEARRALVEIYELAQLEDDSVIEGRLDRSIRISLNDLLINGDKSRLDPALIAQLLAANDVVQELNRFRPNLPLLQIKYDLERSQSITENTMDSFVKVFESRIDSTMKYLVTRLQADPQSDRLRRERDRFCLFLYTLHAWPGKIHSLLEKNCSGARLHSLFPDGPKSVELHSSLLKHSHSKRVCAVRNFLRSEFIYQNHMDRGGSPQHGFYTGIRSKVSGPASMRSFELLGHPNFALESP